MTNFEKLMKVNKEFIYKAVAKQLRSDDECPVEICKDCPAKLKEVPFNKDDDTRYMCLRTMDEIIKWLEEEAE